MEGCPFGKTTWDGTSFANKVGYFMHGPVDCEGTVEGLWQSAGCMGWSEKDVAAMREEAGAATGSIGAVRTGQMVYSTADGFPGFIESRQQGTFGRVSRIDTCSGPALQRWAEATTHRSRDSSL